MLMDLEMHACTSHVISIRDIIYPGLTACNARGWRLADLVYDGGMAGRLTSNLEGYSGETIPLHLIHLGSAVDKTQILTILIIKMEMSYT
jgi:hypothetical protein